jgi:hypothetical protein
MKFLNTDAKKQRRLVHVPMGRFGEAGFLFWLLRHVASVSWFRFLSRLSRPRKWQTQFCFLQVMSPRT